MIARPASPDRSRVSIAGFTLIEMIVALTLLSVLGMLLMGSIGFGSRVAAAVTQGSGRLDQLWTAFALMRNQVAAARPPAKHVRDAETFVGTADVLAFIAPSPPRLAMGGDQQVAFRIEASSAGQRLVADWYSPTGTDKIFRSVLIDGLANAGFSYFGPRAAQEPSSWQSDWASVSALPLLVRFSASFADGSRPTVLVVAPRSTRGDG